MGIKYKIDYNFFKSWSREMSYVLGSLFADGSLEDSPYIRGKYIRFASTDRTFVQRVKHLMGSGHKIVRIEPNGNRKVKYYIRIGSRSVYSDLEKLGLFPNKSLSMTFPAVPDFYMADFIRGYFDGDGSVVIDRYKKNKPGKRLKAIFTSGSKEFLQKLDGCLQKCSNIDGSNFYNSHRSFQLIYRRSKAKKVLDFIYKDLGDNLYLRRKYLFYNRALRELRLKAGDVPK